MTFEIELAKLFLDASQRQICLGCLCPTDATRGIARRFFLHFLDDYDEDDDSNYDNEDDDSYYDDESEDNFNDNDNFGDSFQVECLQ